jgi:hypothetical protein
MKRDLLQFEQASIQGAKEKTLSSEFADARRLIEELARRAGSFLLEHFREDSDLLALCTSAKEAATRYDRMSDELIIRGIRRRVGSCRPIRNGCGSWTHWMGRGISPTGIPSSLSAWL